MNIIQSISQLPKVAAVYAMYGGRGRSKYVAYVGIAKSLRSRAEQHLVRRDSSVTTGASAVSLNPDLVTEVRWWEHPTFGERETLEAAELVAFEVLEPVLRSRGGITEQAREIYSGEAFRTDMNEVFQGECAGTLIIPSLQDALGMIDDLRKRVAELEKRDAT